MRFIKKFALLISSVLVILASAGCDNRAYGLYTNIPQDGFEILNNNFKLNLLSGYSDTEKDFEEEDTSGYKSAIKKFYAMVAEAELVVSADFDRDGETEKYQNFCKEVQNVLNDIDKALSTTVANSDISLFNNAEAGEKIEIREITYDVLETALSVYEMTEGFYNPALYYNIYAYGFGGSYNLPESAEDLPKDEVIERYTDLAVHFKDLELSESNGRYYVIKPSYTVEANGETLSLKLDLGGIGKGYAVDRVDELFNEYGYKYGYFNFAASSMLVKTNIKTAQYDLVLTNPRSPSREPFMTTTARNEKFSTSGDNEQFYTINGVRYCHIIDPTTGKPVQTGIMSVTVLGGSAAVSDALTTAIMAMGKEKAIEFIGSKLTDRRVVFTCE